MSDFTDDGSNPLFDLQGNYRHRHAIHHIDIKSPHLQDGVLPTCPQVFDAYDAEITDTDQKITPTKPKYSSYIPNFAWQFSEVVKKTFEATTQYIQIPVSTHLMNQKPIDWFSKKQPTHETATNGSEYIAARTCVELIIDI